MGPTVDQSTRVLDEVEDALAEVLHTVVVGELLQRCAREFEPAGGADGHLVGLVAVRELG